MCAPIPSGTWRPRRPIPKVVTRKIIKQQIQHAKLICNNFEDSFECISAWEHVQDLEDRLNAIEDMAAIADLDEWATFDELKDREYDL